MTGQRDESGAGPEVDRQPLDVFFEPGSVAVIGASDKPGSVGRRILWNLISSPFGGTVYAVNPKRRNVLGLRAYPRVTDLPEPIDLAMVLTPAATVPGVIEECVAAGVKGAIIISAGFRETGEKGRELEDEIRRLILTSSMRVIGPNSLGVMNPVGGLNAAYAGGVARKGSVGFISQSGALCAAILDWSFQVNVGFSAFVSFGSMVDVGWAELMFHLGNDPNTKSIVIYLQSLGEARSFLSAAREVALTKPVIVLKASQTKAAAAAAEASAYYAGYDTCSDDVLSAALRRSGVLRVDDVESLFALADVLGKQPRPEGRRLTIVSNAAGPGMLATDALVTGGGELAKLSDETLDRLNALLPEYWNHCNPIDIVADADPERYARVVDIVSKDENSDGLLVVLTPQVMTDPTGTAKAIAELDDYGGKPILASWMGGNDVAEGEAILNAHNIPVYPYPDMAARVFDAMWRYSYNLRALYETPELQPDQDHHAPDRREAERIIDAARASGRTTLDEDEARAFLAAYGIPLDPPRSVGALEITISSDIDPLFGPFLTFGPGGAIGKLVGQRGVGLPPLNSTLARRLMEQTRLYDALHDSSPRCDASLSELDHLLMRFSYLVAEQRGIRTMALDPVLIAEDAVTVAGAQITLHDPATNFALLPDLAIRPYPSEYTTTCVLKDGREVTLRPIRPEDESLMVRFHETLSKDTVYFRFLRLLAFDQRVRHERLSRMCFLDYDRAMAIIALRHAAGGEEQQVLGVSRMVKVHGTRDADFAIVISDDVHGLGLGHALLSRLVDVARAEGLRRLTGIVLPDNRPMLRLCSMIGFHLDYSGRDEVVATYDLTKPPPTT